MPAPRENEQMSMTASIESQEQHWAGEGGDRWLAYHQFFEQMIDPIGQSLIEKAQLRENENCIDIGCGAGVTTIKIAQAVGKNGSVIGVDISQALIQACRARAHEKKLENINFISGDAAQIMLQNKIADCLFSRFGAMFFKSPVAAFHHLHQTLKPGGRLALSCWAAINANLWMSEIRDVLAGHLELPMPQPRAPGPFAFAEPSYIEEILDASGFEDILITPWTGTLIIGGRDGTPEDTASSLLNAFSIANPLKDEPLTKKERIHAALSDRLSSYHTEGGILMPAKAWVVTALSKD